MNLKLIREKPDGIAVRGKLYIAEPLAPVGAQSSEASRSSSFCEKERMLEEQERGFSTLENLDYIIPAGTYPLTVTYSPKFKRPLPLVNDVPNRSGIRIHPGSKPEHSRGCILVSCADEEKIKELINSHKINQIQIIDQ